MLKKIFIFLIVGIFVLINTSNVLAERGAGELCYNSYPQNPTEPCITNYSCLYLLPPLSSEQRCLPSSPQAGIGAGLPCDPRATDPSKLCITGFECGPLPNVPPPPDYRCIPSSGVSETFGKIQLPNALKSLLAKDQTGAGAISQFLSNGIILIYSIATIVLIFMLLWGAFDWMTSGGDKEKLAGAQRKIMNAIIGITLFAVAFAVIQVLGTFTGFKFFEGQQ